MYDFIRVPGKGSAVLRRDISLPRLILRQESLCYNMLPYVEDMTLSARLEGSMCASQVTINVYSSEVNNLIEQLTAFSALRLPLFSWETLDRRLHLRIAIDREKISSNVTCDMWLRDGYDEEEEHHCVLHTNLPWIDSFLEELRQMLP